MLKSLYFPRCLVIAVMLVLAITLPFSAHAQTPSGNGPTDARDVQAFLDPLIADSMAKSHIPGVVVVVVKDGQILYQKGYGYADLAKSTPMTPDSTVLRVLSISKVFTAVAIMQLAEQGKINLNENVNKYLKHFQIADPYPQPVTIANLLTHTAGFDSDNYYLGRQASSASDIPPMSSYLAANPPSLLWAPGEHYLYSNAGTATLGQVVEDVSNRPFPQYVTENIFTPLGMTHSSFEPAAAAAADVAHTYMFSDNEQVQVPLSYFKLPPPSAMTTTANDMANFMLAILQDGEYQGTHILQAETVHEMQQEHFTYNPGETGMAYGFNQLDWPPGGIWKDGGGPNSPTSRMTLLPAQHLGFFVHYNSDDSSALAYDVSNHFVLHYFPYPSTPAPQPQADFASQAARFPGVYRFTDYAHLTIAKLVTLQNGDFPEMIADNGGLKIRWDDNSDDDTPRLVQTAPLYFTGPDKDPANPGWRVHFQQGPNQEITGFTFGIYEFEKVPWYDTTKVQEGILALFALVFLIAPLATLAWFLRSRHSRTNSSQVGSPAERLVGFLPALIGLLDLAFLVLVGWTLLHAFDPALNLRVGAPVWLLVILTIPLVTTVLSIALGVLIILTWRGQRSNVGRAALAVFTVLSLVFILYLTHWNLLGYHF